MFFRRSLTKVLAEPNSETVLRTLYERIDRRRPLSFAQQGVVDTWWLFAEVSNGTFDQYIHNSAGDHFGRVKAFFERVGTSSALAVLTSVCEIFPDRQVPADRNFRVQAFEAWIAKEGQQSAEDRIRKATNALISLRPAVSSAIVDFIKEHEEEYERA
jgi:hypothetical protein